MESILLDFHPKIQYSPPKVPISPLVLGSPRGRTADAAIHDDGHAMRLALTTDVGPRTCKRVKLRRSPDH